MDSKLNVKQELIYWKQKNSKRLTRHSSGTSICIEINWKLQKFNRTKSSSETQQRQNTKLNYLKRREIEAENRRQKRLKYRERDKKQGDNRKNPLINLTTYKISSIYNFLERHDS
ncbi:hypothetical protein Bca4012_056568 [Brassica carinata]